MKEERKGGMKMVRLIDDQTVRELLTMEDAVEIVEKTFEGLGKGKVINPAKVNLDLGQTGDYPYHGGFINAMPAYVDFANIAGLKWVVGMDGKRAEAGLPYINSMMLLVHPEYGEFVSVLDGTYISNLRTGAQSAVALKNLLSQKEISLGIFGTGTQGRMQVKALSEVFKITKLSAWDYNVQNASDFAEEMQPYIEQEINVCENVEDAVNHDVLITVSLAQEPFLNSDHIKPGTIICPMGSFQEVTDELLLKADYCFVDHPAQALHRGALEHLSETDQIDEDYITATFGELVTGAYDVPDLSDKITICIPIGIGALDVALAGHVYHLAKERNLGVEHLFTSYDPKDYIG